MADDIADSQKTLTLKSQIDWSQNTISIPTIWGRLYSNKVSLGGKHCWKSDAVEGNTEYFDLINKEFSLGRSLSCTLVMKKNILRQDIITSISKQHFIITRDTSEYLSPAIITDMSYNGTFVNGQEIGKGNSRVLDDNDEISISHALVKIFLYKDLLKVKDGMPKLISEKYYISRTLGQGARGVVKLIYDKVNGTKHAMKIVKKVKFTDGTVETLCDPVKIKNEIDIMKSLKHPLIVSIEDVYQSNAAVYIVLELMEGGELFDRISSRGKLPEAQAKFFFRQMIVAVMYLHSQGITHRDLKPENVLLESKDDDTRVKISDFGLSKFVGAASMKTTCGTPMYMAPEVLVAGGTSSYGPQADVWSLGVILFVCLSGYFPFSEKYSNASLDDQIITGRWHESAPHWEGVGLRARDLVCRMLRINPAKRITPSEILGHTWLSDVKIQIKVERFLLNPEVCNTAISDDPKNDIENRPLANVRARRALSEHLTVVEYMNFCDNFNLF